MAIGYVREVEKARLYVAEWVGRGDVVHGMAVIEGYLRACAFRSFLLNTGISALALAPAIVLLLVVNTGAVARIVLVVAMVLVAFVAAIDFARAFLNHEGWDWLWPRPPEALSAAFDRIWPGGVMVHLDTIRIMCDPFGRRRCVPELRLNMAHRV